MSHEAVPKLIDEVRLLQGKLDLLNEFYKEGFEDQDAEIVKLKEALQFYANREKWAGAYAPSVIELDRGKIARQALYHTEATETYLKHEGE